MCKYRLEPIPFCICQNLNPSTLAASNLLPTKQRRNRFVFFVYGCANASLDKFPFARAKTPIQTHFHLQSCYPQTKKQHCSICSARGQKLEIRAACLAWCTNVECACTPPEAELQRSADENIRGHKGTNIVFCTVHVQCTQSARYSARHSARPQNAVNTTSFPKNNQKTRKKKIFL